MNFFKKNAMYIVPAPWLFLSSLEFWMAAHQGGDTKYIAAVGFGCLAVMFYFGQKRRYEALRARGKMNSNLGS
jgi:hypothetical protein